MCHAVAPVYFFLRFLHKKSRTRKLTVVMHNRSAGDWFPSWRAGGKCWIDFPFTVFCAPRRRPISEGKIPPTMKAERRENLWKFPARFWCCLLIFYAWHRMNDAVICHTKHSLFILQLETRNEMRKETNLSSADLKLNATSRKSDFEVSNPLLVWVISSFYRSMQRS